MRVMIGLAIVLAALHAAVAHEEGETAKPVDGPPLSREQAESLVAEARKAYKAGLLKAMVAFQNEMATALKDAEGETRQAVAALKAELDEQIPAVEQDRYVSSFAGEAVSFAIAPLADARQAYVDRLAAADRTYVDALQGALARDRDGHIGNMMIRELDESIDITLMWLLMDWYWHHGTLDTPPGSFERIIRLGYRYVELEPQSPGVYTNTAWLLWSRWVSWKMDAKRMPIGEGDDATAERLLLAGRAANKDNAQYHFDAAMTLWGLAKYHDAKYYKFITDSLKLADEHATDDKLRTRARLTLAHSFHQQKMMKEAETWFRKVLEVDPENKVAARILKEIADESVTPARESDGDV